MCYGSINMEPALDQGTGTRAVGVAVQVQGANRVLGLAAAMAQEVVKSGDDGGGSKLGGGGGVAFGTCDQK